MKPDASLGITPSPAASYSPPQSAFIPAMARPLQLKFLSLLALVVGGVWADKDFMLPPPPASYGYAAPTLRSGLDLRAEASSIDNQDPLEALAAAIPGGGVPGQDYPLLAAVPDTGFSCTDQQFPGYYADTAGEAACQVFHICQSDGRQDSFLCPNGTAFSQQFFVCDWWYNVDCAASDQFFARNADIGAVMAEATAASLRSDALGPSQQYAAPQQRQAVSAPSQQYAAPQQQQAVSAPSQQYAAPQQRQAVSAPSQQYAAPQQRQAVSAPSQQYAAPQQRQAVSAPSQQYAAPQQRQAVSAPSQQYAAPQQRQAVSAPFQQYAAPQERQASPAPSRLYSF